MGKRKINSKAQREGALLAWEAEERGQGCCRDSQQAKACEPWPLAPCTAGGLEGCWAGPAALWESTASLGRTEPHLLTIQQIFTEYLLCQEEASCSGKTSRNYHARWPGLWQRPEHQLLWVQGKKTQPLGMAGAVKASWRSGIYMESSGHLESGRWRWGKAGVSIAM